MVKGRLLIMTKRTKSHLAAVRLKKSRVVSTTIGELIEAITEAARESSITERDVSSVTRKVLDNILRSATTA